MLPARYTQTFVLTNEFELHNHAHNEKKSGETLSESSDHTLADWRSINDSSRPTWSLVRFRRRSSNMSHMDSYME